MDEVAAPGGHGTNIAAELSMNTLQAWIKAHPGVNVLAFERNSDKSLGFGDYEEVCGFCLASHYFDGEPPEFCKFCRAPLRETRIISDLSEIRSRIYNFSGLSLAANVPIRTLPFVVPRANRANGGINLGPRRPGRFFP